MKCKHVWYSDVAFHCRVQSKDWCVKCTFPRLIGSSATE